MFIFIQNQNMLKRESPICFCGLTSLKLRQISFLFLLLCNVEEHVSFYNTPPEIKKKSNDLYFEVSFIMLQKIETYTNQNTRNSCISCLCLWQKHWNLSCFQLVPSALVLSWIQINICAVFYHVTTADVIYIIFLHRLQQL